MRSSPSNISSGSCSLRVAARRTLSRKRSASSVMIWTNGLVTDELLDIACEIQNEEARDPVRLDSREDQNGDLVELVESVLEGNKTLRQKVEIWRIGWPNIGQPCINDLARAVFASSSLRSLADVWKADVCIRCELNEGRHGEADARGVVSVNGILDDVHQVAEAPLICPLDHLLALVAANLEPGPGPSHACTSECRFTAMHSSGIFKFVPG